MVAKIPWMMACPVARHGCQGFMVRRAQRPHHRLTLKGESLRKAAAKRQKLDDEPAN